VIDRLTLKERRAYESGDWVAAHGPRCKTCGCLEDNHRTDGSCAVCGCPGYEERA
jgi:hypothetical protein